MGIASFFRGLLTLCDKDKPRQRPVISAPMGNVQYPPIPSHYDPGLPPPVFSLTHAPYQPGRQFDSYGEPFKPKSIGLPHGHPLRPRITSSLYSRPSDGGETYAQRAHPKRPASSMYSRPTDGSAYGSGRSVGLPSGLSSGYTSGYTSQVGSIASQSKDPLRELNYLIKAAKFVEQGRPMPPVPFTAEEQAQASREMDECRRKLLPFLFDEPVDGPSAAQ